MSLRQLLPESEGAPDAASSADRSFRSREGALWIVAGTAMFLDVVLTVYGLQLGLSELNPIARSVFETAGAFGLYGLKGSALGVGFCCRPLLPRRYLELIPLALAVPSLFAVIVNAMLIAVILV